jgi:hypothetical protein
MNDYDDDCDYGYEEFVEAVGNADLGSIFAVHSS